MSDDTKLPLTSDNPAEALLAQLREQAPHLFSEGKVDWDKLKATLGEAIETGPERYGLTWAGKSEAFRNVQTASVGTLLPMPNESVNFDTSENLIIEGDNLEVLKLLQKSYHSKVKMIYIDPPYNTGNEFIYPDNYREGLDEYLRYSGQVSDEGLKQSTNTETSGRFHSKWLNMMFPRLFLARNLLRDDGVIFVSIDDNEVHNLRMLLNEVFGEENFIASICWQKTYSPANDKKGIDAMHDYVLCYGRTPRAAQVNLLPRTSKQDSAYSNPDNDPRGPWKAVDATRAEHRDYAYYGIVTPSGKEVWPAKGRSWVFTKEEVPALIANGLLWFGKAGDSKPSKKLFLSEVKQGIVPTTWWPHEECGHNDESKKELKRLFPEDLPFSTPKPKRLIQRMLSLATSGESTDIVLDFFAGSGTTGDAVLTQNAEDSGKRRYILVQLPEVTDNPSFPTIAHITRERVRRVIANHDENTRNPGSTANREDGFRAFKLSSSNFKIWNANQAAATDAQQLAEQLQLYANNMQGERSQDDILFELVLKSGLPLSSKVEQIEMEGKPVHAIADGQLLICLENPINQGLLRGMMAREPLQILCLDAAFQGNDPLKTNAVLEAKSHGITFRTV